MSAPITTRLLRLRPTSSTTLHHFSTTPNNPPTFPQPESEPESPLLGIKSTFQNQNPSRTHLSQPRFNFSHSNQQTHFQNQSNNNNFQPRNNNNFQPRINQSESFQKVQQNLAQFRSRTAPPPPSSANKPISFSNLFKNSSTDAKSLESSILSTRLSNNLNGPGFNKGGFRNMEFKGGFQFGPTKDELGERLRGLRPEKRMGEWFSIREISDRLVRLKEIEKEEKERRLVSGEKGGVAINLRSFLSDFHETDNLKAKTVHRLDAISSLGGTPSYMMYPPKEELLEQYFHPDNMSSAEKMKLELKKVRDEFKMSESDCGSARVQVAQLTTKIKHLSTVLAKKDKHSRKGLQEMVQKRKKLLKYLRRTDWDSYSLVLSKLGLRDNPEIKAELMKKKDQKAAEKKPKKKKNKKKKTILKSL